MPGPLKSATETTGRRWRKAGMNTSHDLSRLEEQSCGVQAFGKGLLGLESFVLLTGLLGIVRGKASPTALPGLQPVKGRLLPSALQALEAPHNTPPSTLKAKQKSLNKGQDGE